MVICMKAVVVIWLVDRRSLRGQVSRWWGFEHMRMAGAGVGLQASFRPEASAQGSGCGQYKSFAMYIPI